MAGNGERQHVLVLREGGVIYKSLILCGWPHWKLVGGHANLCQVFWSVALGVPFVATFKAIYWLVAMGTRQERFMKIGGLILLGAAIVGLVAGLHMALAVIVVAFLAALAVGVIFGLAFVIVKGVRALDEGNVPSMIGMSISRRGAFLGVLFMSLGELFTLIGAKLRALKARVCPPILFTPRT